MIEDLNDLVTTAAGYITLINCLLKALLWLIPKVEKSFKKRRRHKGKK